VSSSPTCPTCPASGLSSGDAGYDPRNSLGPSQPSPLPALWAKTSYLWTVSDPQLAAVNGEDALPDLAIGRLPAATVEQAQMLVDKLIAWEDSGQGLSGPAALVADNSDLAGDFEADVEDIRASFLGSREAKLLKLSEPGGAMRPAVRDPPGAGPGQPGHGPVAGQPAPEGQGRPDGVHTSRLLPHQVADGLTLGLLLVECVEIATVDESN